MSYIEEFKRSNAWFKGEDIYDMSRMVLREDVRVIVWEDGSSGVIDENLTDRSGWFNREGRWNGTVYFKDFTSPATQEKEMFHMLFGWEIPWSEECPLIL